MTSGTTRSEAGPETRASARLSAANRAALAQVRASARREAGRHMRRIAAVLKATGVDADPEAVLQAASVQGVLIINFHPDRLLADGRPVAAALRDDGVYRSQLETRISNGGGARPRRPWATGACPGPSPSPGYRRGGPRAPPAAPAPGGRSPSPPAPIRPPPCSRASARSTAG